MLASSVFAPVAMAQETLAPGEIYSVSVTYRPDSDFNLPVTVTFQCTEGYQWGVGAAVFEADQKQAFDKGKPVEQAAASPGDSGTCETTGPQSGTTQLGLGVPPLTKKSKIWVRGFAFLCEPTPGGPCNVDESKIERVRIP
jgi:hypothetical protein